jgi:hypothetical protein
MNAAPATKIAGGGVSFLLIAPDFVSGHLDDVKERIQNKRK